MSHKVRVMRTEMQRQKIDKIEVALSHLTKHETECKLCPRECGVDRKSGEKGFCQTASQAVLSHAILHFGEEPVLSGLHDCAKESGRLSSPRSGSGALFFAGCNLKCCFCQNFQISWFNQGVELDSDELAAQMMDLQNKGALNINLVSPSHVLVPILKALQKAYAQGLRLPLVHNSNGYEKAEVVRHLEGIVDIFLPDFKYFSPELSETLSRAPDYFHHASASFWEMYRQKPEFICDDQDIAQKGLIIRHLVLPGQCGDSIKVLEWLEQNCREGTALSLMSQYKPCHRAPSSFQRPVSIDEYNRVLEKALECGFETLFIQPEPFASGEHRTPDFNRKNPFDWS
jgi:putative pyruvate formate lyase activating enzyme